jgi:peptide/nickel transport system ATP-binding protein
MTAPLLEIRNLTIENVATGACVVCDVDLELASGEVLAIIGESGSGKTTLALAALGHVRTGLRIAS